MDVGEVHDGIVLRKRFVVIEFQVVDTFEPSFELVFLSRVLLAHNHMYIRQDMPPVGEAVARLTQWRYCFPFCGLLQNGNSDC